MAVENVHAKNVPALALPIRRVAAKQTGRGEPAVPEPSVPKADKETPNEPSPAKRSKGGLVGKRRKPKSILRLVDEYADEGVPISEPRVDDEETDHQQAVELSLKDLEARNQGPTRNMVIREPNFRRIQSFLEVQVKGKEKIIEEKVAYTLLDLNTLKKKSAADEYILQRCTPKTAKPTGSSSQPEDKGITMTNSEMESDEAGSNPGKQDEGQARSNPGNAAESQPKPSHVVHAGPTLKPMDLEFTDASTQQNLEKMDEEFTTTAYPNEVSFTGQFFVDKPHEEEPEKTNDESEETGSYKIYEDHKNLSEALEKSMDRDHSDQLQADLAEAHKKRRKRPDPPRTPSGSSPPPLPPPRASSAPGASEEWTQELWILQNFLLLLSGSLPPPPPSLGGLVLQELLELHGLHNYLHLANALATTYQAPIESSLLKKTRDMRTFMNWYCQKTSFIFSFGWKSVTRCLQIRLTRLIQKVEDLQLSIESYQKQLNITKPGWDAKGFEYKHDYTIIESPCAVVFPVSNNERNIMMFNKIYKFSDGMMTNILEALDYKVKEYKVNRLNSDSRPEGSSETWIALLVVESDIYTGNPVKEILLKLNVPDHRIDKVFTIRGSGFPNVLQFISYPEILTKKPSSTGSTDVGVATTNGIVRDAGETSKEPDDHLGDAGVSTGVRTRGMMHSMSNSAPTSYVLCFVPSASSSARRSAASYPKSTGSSVNKCPDTSSVKEGSDMVLVMKMVKRSQDSGEVEYDGKVVLVSDASMSSDSSSV
uniref:Uncharacterized protein n=1 Tax=Tanacetum cinerariifolium TaxID=118510 RepID=A0A6L2M7A1_TANCI|nr:hypothetical protein [Tanacetum cinerariifolium]